MINNNTYLNNITELMGLEEIWDNIAPKILENAIQATGTKTGALALLENGYVRVRLSGKSTASIRGAEFIYGQRTTPMEWLTMEKKITYAVRDAFSKKARKFIASDLVDAGIGSYLCCPMRVGDRRIGWLYVGYPYKSSFNKEIKSASMYVAERIAYAYLISEPTRVHHSIKKFLNDFLLNQTDQSSINNIFNHPISYQANIEANRVFVAHPFKNFPKEDFRESIRSSLKKLKLRAVFPDDELTNAHILQKLYVSIRDSQMSIFELSDWNPNVTLELGLALTLGKPTVLLVREDSKVISDLAGLDRIEYSQNVDLRKKLITMLPDFLKKTY